MSTVGLPARARPGELGIMDLLIPLSSAAAVGLAAIAAVLAIVVPMARGLFAGRR